MDVIENKIPMWINKSLLTNDDKTAKLAKDLNICGLLNEGIIISDDSITVGHYTDIEQSNKMKRVSGNEVATLRANGWGVGDILRGEENGKPDFIVITSIGESNFECRWLQEKQGQNFWRESRSSTTLSCREWVKVGNIFENFSDIYIMLFSPKN